MLHENEEKMTAESNAITILPLNDAQLRSMIASVDSSDKMYNFNFPLTDSPTQGWAATFSDLWHQEHQNASARISEDTVVLVCRIDELTQMFPILKDVVASTNEKQIEIIRGQAATEAAAQRTKLSAKQTAQAALSEALNQLNFS
jgi:hypothetical protein